MATIFCYSSTGNSLYVAKKISQEIGADVKPMTSQITKTEDDCIGFVFPCYYWGLPLRVEEFINNLEITNKNAYIFAIITYGSTIMGIHGIVKNMLKKKGLKLSYGMKIKSVENYILNFKVNNTEYIFNKADRQIDLAISNIKSQKQNFSPFPFFIHRIVQSFFPANKPGCNSKFTVSDNCTGCGICEKVCLVKNIKIIDGKPSFVNKCEHCLGCIHACPSQAINWNGKTEGKQRYLNPNIKLQELMNFNSQE